MFKYGDSGSLPRSSSRIPTTGPTDSVDRLFRHRISMSRPTSSSPFFRSLDLARATQAGLYATKAKAPLETRFTPRSLRSGGITAGYASGVFLERIMRLSNHVPTAIVYRHYLDPLVPLVYICTGYFSSVSWSLLDRLPCRLRQSRLRLALTPEPPALQPSALRWKGTEISAK